MENAEVVEATIGPLVAPKLVSERGESLELITWHGEPAVIVDGVYVVTYSLIRRQLMHYKRREVSA